MTFLKLLVALSLSATLVHATTDETVTLGGTKVILSGTKISVGDTAPQIKLIDNEFKEVMVGGKTKETQVFVVVPSIDTPICDLEARTFNKEASKLKNVKIYVISMDLPFAGKRYCAAHGINNIQVLSDFQDRNFGFSYGTMMGEGALKGIEARVIFIVKDGKVTYKQLVPEIKERPDFEAVLKAI
jgi:thiol peroxidase